MKAPETCPFPTISFLERPSFPGRHFGDLLMQRGKVFTEHAALFAAVEGKHRNHRGAEGGEDGA